MIYDEQMETWKTWQISEGALWGVKSSDKGGSRSVKIVVNLKVESEAEENREEGNI